MQAALFAGFLSAFLIELLHRLEPDPMDIIQDVLIYQTQMMRNSSLGPYVPAEFSPPEYIVVVNALFYGSLGVILLAAFIAMLIKTWVREFDRGLRAMSMPEQRAKTREFRYLGMERWKLIEMVGILPLLIHLSLFLFAIGLVLFLSHLSEPSFGVTIAIFGIGVLYYVITTWISVFVASSPFHSHLSRALGTVYQQMHAYFCPGIGVFLSSYMDITPTTALGRARRRIQIFLQKSRPYPETDFVEPVVATTMDDIQISIASSALKRIHESVPNSQHSEAIQWSVWQVAGNPTLCIPASFDLPSWVIKKVGEEEYSEQLPPSMAVTLLAAFLRTPRAAKRIYPHFQFRSVLSTIKVSKRHWARVVDAVFGHLGVMRLDFPTLSTDSSVLPNTIRREELQGEECIWLLNTLSCLHSDWWDWHEESSIIDICLAVYSSKAPTWRYHSGPDVVLLEAGLTLAAISHFPDRAHRLDILNNSRQHPWLLPNLRNLELIRRLVEDTQSSCHEQLTSLLFIILYALMLRGSGALAEEYFSIITAKGDFPLYTCALTVAAPIIGDIGLYAITRTLVASRTQSITPGFSYCFPILRSELIELLEGYDDQLGGIQNPDPNILAILLLISKDFVQWEVVAIRNPHLNLNNPWLRLVARVIGRLGIPDGSYISMELFYDHKVHSMFAAQSLLRYAEEQVTQYTESLLLASFLQSQEISISSMALKYYMRTIASYPEVPAPPPQFSLAVRAVFNFILPDHYLRLGWIILDIFLHGFEKLSVEWRRTFAVAFFTPLRQPLPRLRGSAEANTPEDELREILTWEYFHEEEQAPEFTDTAFNGIDWMAIAWSYHLSRQSGTKSGSSAHMRDPRAPTVNEEFVLQVLCKLLDAAPYYLIVPIVPKLREFVQWFNDAELPEYHRIISAQMEESVRRHQVFQRTHQFHRFQCMWDI